MANKQRGPLPPVLSSEETRVKPPQEEDEEDAAELPPEPPTWDEDRDSTRLMPNAAPPGDENEGDPLDDATPPVPRKIDPVPYDDDVQGPDEATRNIPLKAGARPALQGPDDSTRPIPRKTGARPALQDPDDATRPIPRKTGARPALQDSDDSTRPIPRKTGARPALQDSDDSTRPIPRKTGTRQALQDSDDAPRPPARKSGVTPSVGKQAAPLPWDAGENEAAALPTRAQSLPPIASGPHQALVSPPSGPPVLVPMHTEPHYIPQAPIVPVVTQPNYIPPPPAAPTPVITSPNYVPPPPAVVTPVVTAPHLLPPLQPLPVNATPPGEELRTAFSNKAAMVADLIKATFARRSYGTASYRLRIDEPDGPSTAGGLLARQPISLVSNLETAPAVVCGWVDVAKKEAQLRSYAVVERRHKARYAAAPDITDEEYERFLNELVETLFYGGIKIVVQIPDDPDPTQAQGAQAQGVQAKARGGGRSSVGTLLLVIIVFALGLFVGMNMERLTASFRALGQ
ncbi:hypothetical protein [Hyalangium versicolor]|uniref:hypothetical protein n=1 Tax=Hyalangium versicolor TaxID=2861190 RepID=UPI001CCF68DE|nr:hypothetical protein [Hyalangium versicolor]